MINPTQFRVSAYGILSKGSRVLVASTRTKGGIISNFPGGKIELGESPRTALIREFMEETGLTVTIGDLLHVTDGVFVNPYYPTEQQLYLYYSVSTASLEAQAPTQAADIASIRWVEVAEMPPNDMQPVDIEAWHTIRSRILSGSGTQ